MMGNHSLDCDFCGKDCRYSWYEPKSSYKMFCSARCEKNYEGKAESRRPTPPTRGASDA